MGSKKNIAQGVSMRVMLKGNVLSPMFWWVRYWGAVDMVRQCGLPLIFKTQAPYEWTTPYPDWVLSQMQTQLRPRQHLPGPETYCLAHSLTEYFRGYFLGGDRKHGDSSRLWKC